MASKKVIGNTDFLWNQAERFSLERRAESPEIKQAGGLYFNTKDNCPYYCDGKKWKPIASDSQVDLSSVEPLLVRSNDYEGVSEDYETILTAYLCGRTVLLMDESAEYGAMSMIFVASGVRSFNEPGSTDGSWTNRITFTNTALMTEQYSNGEEVPYDSLLTFWVAEIAYTEGTETNGVPTPNHTALIRHQPKGMQEYVDEDEEPMPPFINIIYYDGVVENYVSYHDVFNAWECGIPIYLTYYSTNPGSNGSDIISTPQFATKILMDYYGYERDASLITISGQSPVDYRTNTYDSYDISFSSSERDSLKSIKVTKTEHSIS